MFEKRLYVPVFSHFPFFRVIHAFCVGFRKLYRQQPKAYRVWAKKEQERLLLIDVLARPTTLGHCLQKYLDDNKLDDLSGQFYFLTRVEALRGSTDEPRQQQLEACAIYEHFFNPNSDSYKELVLDQDERNRVQRYLSSICDEGSKGEYDPKTRIFDAAFRTIHGAIEAAQPPVLPEFFGSKSFQACHGGRKSVRRDLTSFGRLRNEYCQTEANAADERLGESDGRYKLMSALLQTWKELCEQDPLFWPKFLPVPPMQPSGLDESALQQQ